MIDFIQFLRAEWKFWKGKEIDKQSFMIAAMVAYENSFEQDAENKAAQQYMLRQLREQKCLVHLDVIHRTLKITRIADDEPTVQ
jgi:hypothetical protein